MAWATRGWLLLVLAGCGGDEGKGPGPDADTDTDADADADADTDADTDTDTAAPVVTVSCAPVDNVLRAACTVTTEPPSGVELRWRRSDGTGPERGVRDGGAASVHELAIQLLAPESEYAVTATVPGTAATAATTFTTGTPPFDVGAWLTVTGTSTMGLVGTANLCSLENAYAVVFDTETGALVWYQDIDPTGTFGTINMIRFTDHLSVVGETGDALAEVDREGRDLARFPTTQYPPPWGLHHDIFERDGLYYGIFQDTRAGLTLDPITVMDATGAEVDRWDPREHLVVPPDATDDFLHTNTVFVTPEGDLLVSWLEQRTVAKVAGDPTAPAFGDILWKMTGTGLPQALGNDVTIDWSAVPEPHFFARQHNVSIRRDGRLMMLDNLNGRGLVMTLDEGALTAHVDAVYPLPVPTCAAQGTTMETATGNVVVACIEDGVREYDLATTSVIWEATGTCRNGRDARAIRWYPLEGWELRLD